MLTDAALRAHIEHLERLTRANPTGRTFLRLAAAYRRAGEPGRARSVLEQGLAYHPDDAAARVLLGRVLLDLGKWAEAQQAFRDALATASGGPREMEHAAVRALAELIPLWGREAIAAAASSSFFGLTRPSAPAPPAAPPALPEAELLTRTLAELCAARGFVGEAAALYRELLTARPGDPAVQARLVELEHKRATRPPPAPEPEEPAGFPARRVPGLVYSVISRPGELERELAGEPAHELAAAPGPEPAGRPAPEADRPAPSAEATTATEPPAQAAAGPAAPAAGPLAAIGRASCRERV